MTVKAGMPTLYKQLKKLPWTAIPATSAVSTDHGRRARRTIKAVLVPAWIEFAGAAQELRDAILVNPHDLDGLKQAIRHAVDLDPNEGTARIRRMRRVVRRHDVQAWARTFLSALHEDGGHSSPSPDRG